MTQTTDEIKGKLDIVDLVSETVTLKKYGRAYSGLCPFHNNTDTPALAVWTDTGTWKCFGTCNTGGDVFSWVMKRDGVEFKEALELLARRTGVELKPMTTEQRKQVSVERDRQRDMDTLLDLSAAFYAKQLWESPKAADAQSFVTSRGFTLDHLRAIRWGWSDCGDGLMKHIARHAAKLLPLAQQAGLVRSDCRDFTANADGKEKSPEGWIVYPHTESGRVVFLSSRAVNQETKDKSRNLPGARQIYRADYDLRTKTSYITPHQHDGMLVVCEGPADAESLRAWGIPSWAMCGAPMNADTDDGKRVLDRLLKRAERDTLYSAMSNDANGAGLRFSYSFSGDIGPLTRVVIWPKGERDKKSDANSCLQAGLSADDVVKLLEESKTYLDCIIADVTAQRDTKKKAEGIDAIAALVARLSETERKIYINEISDRRGLGISRADFVKLVAEHIPHTEETGFKFAGGKFSYWGEPLSNFEARIGAQYWIDDGLNPPTIRYHITGQAMNGALKPLREIEIESEEFDSPKWIGKYWGADAIPFVSAGKYNVLKRGILEQSQKDMKRESQYIFTGWHTVNGKRAFLSSSGALTADGLDTSARVDLPNNLAYYSLPPAPTGQDLIESIRASIALIDLAPETVTVPLWTGMYASVMRDVKPLRSALWVYGQTQSKKTATTGVFLCHFGTGFVQGREVKSVIDWTSTTADIEGTMFTTKDVPLVIDDYAPQFTSAQEAKDMGKKAHYVVRSVGNESSRGRRKADMSARVKYIPRCQAIVTAELPLVGEGIEGRLVTIVVDRNTVNVDQLTLAQQRKGLLSQAMSGFITWRLNNPDHAIDYFNRRVAEAQAEVQNSFSGHDRLTDYFSVLSATSRLVLHWAASIGAINDSEEIEHATLNDMALLELLQNQDKRIGSQSPVLKFWRALDDLLTQGRAVIQPKDNEQYAIPYGAVSVGWGYDDKRQLYLNVNQALTLVKAYYAGIDEPFSTLADALRREIWQFKLLAERDEEQIECSKYINGSEGNKRVLVIDAERVYVQFGYDLLGLHRSISEKSEPVRQ